jgi:hypothetical protein
VFCISIDQKVAAGPTIAAARLAAANAAAAQAAAAVAAVLAAMSDALLQEGLQEVLYATSGASPDAALRWPLAHHVAQHGRPAQVWLRGCIEELFGQWLRCHPPL